MKTAKYDLLSFPGESVLLPKEAVNIGNDFMGKIKKSRSKEDLCKRINEYPALREIAGEGESLLRRANYIMLAKAESPRKKFFIDHIYIQLGMHYSSGKGKGIKDVESMNKLSSLDSRLYKKFN